MSIANAYSVRFADYTVSVQNAFMTPEQTKNSELSKQAFEANSENLNRSDYKSIRDYIYENDEWGFDIETLIAILIEDSTPITEHQYNTINKAAIAMNLTENRTDFHII